MKKVLTITAKRLQKLPPLRSTGLEQLKAEIRPQVQLVLLLEFCHYALRNIRKTDPSAEHCAAEGHLRNVLHYERSIQAKRCNFSRDHAAVPGEELQKLRAKAHGGLLAQFGALLPGISTDPVAIRLLKEKGDPVAIRLLKENPAKLPHRQLRAKS